MEAWLASRREYKNKRMKDRKSGGDPGVKMYTLTRGGRGSKAANRISKRVCASVLELVVFD